MARGPHPAGYLLLGYTGRAVTDFKAVTRSSSVQGTLITASPSFPWGHFAPVKVNDILTLNFDHSDNPRSNHYAFLASDEGVVFGSGPRSRTDGEINHLHQGRGFYFECENGHVWEVITHTCVTG